MLNVLAFFDAATSVFFTLLMIVTPHDNAYGYASDLTHTRIDFASTGSQKHQPGQIQRVLSLLRKSLDSFLDFFAAFFSFGVMAGFFLSSL
jgi:hypothetical protein